VAPRRGLKTKTHFRFRIALWDANAGTILAHVAGIDDLEMAMAAYRAALTRWPNSRVILRQGERAVIGDCIAAQMSVADLTHVNQHAFALHAATS